MDISKSSFSRGVRVLIGTCGLMIMLGVLPPGTEAQTTTRVSVDSNGNESNGLSGEPSLSADGRFVVFSSEATNLVLGDTNGKADIFVYDRKTGQTTRVSVSSNGAQGDVRSIHPVISANGRFIAFESFARLTPFSGGNTNIFVHDRETGQTTAVSIDSDGKHVSQNCHNPAISGDGRFVAFVSGSPDLVPNDKNFYPDIFVHDRETGQTTLVSIASDGTQANGYSDNPSISGDGRFVAFESGASTLVPSDTNAQFDIFVHDRDMGKTTRVSIDSLGLQTQYGGRDAAISADGRFVAFTSYSGTQYRAHLHDRQTGQTTPVSVDSSGRFTSGYGRSISGDGRFVAFESGNDVFVYDRQRNQVTLESVDFSGNQVIAAGFSAAEAAISADGRFVTFTSYSDDLVPGDTNNKLDVFLHDRGSLTTITKQSGPTDLDGNGTSDLLWRNTKTGSTAIWLLNGATIGSAGFPGGVPLAWQIAGIGDVNGDGKADVIWRHITSATVAIWLMNGTTITSVGFPASVPTAWSLQAVGDVNGDGKADLIWRNSNDGNTAIWLMNGARVATSGFLGKVPLAWQLAGAGDVDADGKADLIWRNGTSHAVAIWVMNGLTMTSSGFPGSASPDLQIAGVGDVNGDGKADLIWRNTNSGDVAVWLLNGTTMDSSGIVDRLPSQWQIAQVGDADGDGKADVIWYNTTTGAVVCWLLNGLTIGSEAFPGTVSMDWIITGRPVPPPLSITTASTLPAGTVNKSYSITLARSGGTPSFSWTVFSGSLPPGLTINPSTGQISGTPTTAGKFLATIRVRDSGNPAQSAQELFSLTINAPPAPPPTGGGGGTLTITGAPASVGGTFVVDYVDVSRNDENPDFALGLWSEGSVAFDGHKESLFIHFVYDTGELTISGVQFFSSDTGGWGCSGSFIGFGLPSFPGTCTGVAVNRAAGKVTFSNTVLDFSTTSAPPITLNGTLTFPPF